MKRYLSFILITLFSILVFSDTPPPIISVKDSGDSNYITTNKFNFQNFSGTHTGTQFSLGINSVVGGGTGLSSLTPNGLLLGNGSATPTFLVGGTTGNVVTWNGSTWISSSIPASGTVTSVGLSLPNIFSVSGSPVTSSGTLTGTLANQSVNTFFSGPSSGSSIPPTFRAIVPADIPTLNQNTTGTAANITASSNSTLTTLSSLSLPGSQVSGNISGTASNITASSNSSLITLSSLSLPYSQVTGGPSGSVSSVGLSDSTGIFNITGSPVTTSGTLTLSSFKNQSQAAVFIGPSSGGAGLPSFRSLVSSDVPTLNQNTTGTAANITASSNSTLTTLSALSLPYSQVTGAPSALTFTSPLSLTGSTVSIPVATTSVNGYLSSTDWNTFNGKQASGNYITALTGDVTASGPGSVASTLATVNTNTGSFGSSTAIPNFTVNGKGLITAAGTNVVIAPAGTLSGTTLNSTVVSSSLTSLGNQGQALNMGSHLINAVTDPVSAQDAATKNYVDTSLAALNPAESVYAATTANLTGTYLNGASGVGATFTITATGAFTLDGTTPPVNSRILIKNQSSGFQNGIYNLTVAGTTGVSPVLTRSSDYNTAADMNSAGLIPVINGTVNALSSWQQVATITTVGTDSLVFTEFTANPSLYLLKANNLSDVASASTAFNNIDQLATNSVAGSVSTTTQTFGGNKTFSGTLSVSPGGSTSAVAIDSPNFIFDSTNDALGIGVQPATNVALDVVNSSGSSKPIQTTGYGTGSSVPFRGRFARGTSSSPAAAQNGDNLSVYSGRGYGTSQWPSASTGILNIVAGETFTNTSNATYLQFETTPTGSTTAVEGMRLSPASNLLIGTTTDSGTQKLQVNGNSNVGTVTAGTWNGTATSGVSYLTSGTTYTTPAGTTTATTYEFILIGAGGGGAGNAATSNLGVAGGGAGAVGIFSVTGLTPSTYAIAIGSAGSGGASGANSGASGGATTITIGATTYTAGGGTGGTTGASQAGGAGGTTTNISSIGLAINGQQGGSVGTGAATSLSGVGGSNIYGPGGAAVVVGGGISATGYGGGGSGSKSPTSATAEGGGNGAPGAIIVRWKN